MRLTRVNPANLLKLLCIDEVAPKGDVAAQGGEALVVLRAFPHVGADAPGAVADLADAQAAAAQGTLVKSG